jgi:hypothetical protein
MYELDRNPNFSPTVIFKVLPEEVAAKIPPVKASSNSTNNSSFNTAKLTVQAFSSSNDNNTAIELYESHRMSLVEDTWM